ncbi:hypothetical protein PC41400_14955 [Paenibacillus chitinolyticus]|uniref:Uncharacterized protein n=1 Tax=Paenibacillus chitinolyticus TaxID=79263 RepID=A0A410WWW0_9BACL|nr:hypothetical protein [Paenibacillus chitinolyticus]MCY9592357.1 hypothetical protein [Paenibacillus chitinolyticus]MCY9599818.1 hypothetical protein [Paenibacillus chitinolyticus]QAV18905.1 hypothetical protein PC41400_14955 [Paenibacillus chitinolyticus]
MNKTKLKYVEFRLDLEKKILAELMPSHLRLDFLKHSYIAGGCIYSIYQSQEPKDYDFFLTDESFASQLRKHFLEKESGYHGKEVSGGMYLDYPLTITENAISIGRYQIITRWIGQPKEVVKEFDFRHLQFYYVGNGIETVTQYDFLDSRDLKYNEDRARDICGSVFRSSKFVARGMKISQKEMAKMLLRLKNVGFSEKEVETLIACKEKPDADHFGS